MVIRRSGDKGEKSRGPENGFSFICTADVESLLFGLKEHQEALNLSSVSFRLRQSGWQRVSRE
jgi:hypothetical protein